MRAAVFKQTEPNHASACVNHLEQLDRDGNQHDQDVDFQMALFQATSPDVFVNSWINDPASDLAQIYRCLMVFGNDVSKLGQAVKNCMLNRMHEAAEYTVSQGE